MRDSSRRRLGVGPLLLPVLAVLVACKEVVQSPLTESGQALCLSDYATCIDPILQGNIQGATCAASSCHATGGNGGGFKLNVGAAPGSPEMLANYYSAKGFANLNDPDQSKLLLEPLQGSFGITGSHGGGTIFRSTTDPCFQTIRSWIANRVDDPASPGCGSCTPVADLSVCGR